MNIKLIEKLDQKILKYKKLDKDFSSYRLLIFITGITLFLINFLLISKTSSYIILSIFLAIFLIISHKHSRLINFINQLKILLRIKKDLKARKELDWNNISYQNIPTEESELNRDLNLTGNRSLFHLINLAKDGYTAQKFMSLLLKNRKLDEIKLNQKIIDELSRKSYIINKTLLLSNNYKASSAESINEWLNKNTELKKYNLLLLITYGINLITMLSSFIYGSNIFFISGGLYIFSYYFFSIKTAGIIKNSETIIKEINSFSKLFNFYSNLKLPKSSVLNILFDLFKSNSSLKVIFKKLKRITSIFEIRANPFIWFIIILVYPIDIFLIKKLDDYKNIFRNVYPESVNKYTEVMFFVSLTVFKNNNSNYSFPELMSDSNTLEIKNLGHPLIDKNLIIRNDYTFDREAGIDIITGSNMSGKSTFLRALGINFILAYSGSVVDAKYFRSDLYKIFTCINVSDSVVDGISYFYSEVKRLAKLLDELENNDQKIFLLIDEIFKGTNNKERLEGSKLFVRKLLSFNMFGLISTHDLELANLENESDKIKNYHFIDDIKSEKLSFSYKLNSGVCPSTNAIKIIKASMNI